MREAINKAIESIKTHEGFSAKEYLDSLGVRTIGYGRNLLVYPLSKLETKEIQENKGYSEDMATAWLEDRVDELYERLSNFGWFNHLDIPRQAVILDMAYNLGIKGLLSFKKMIEALKSHNYKAASKEMIDSLWAAQVKTRALALSELMVREEFDV